MISHGYMPYGDHICKCGEAKDPLNFSLLFDVTAPDVFRLAEYIGHLTDVVNEIERDFEYHQDRHVDKEENYY